MGVSPAKDVPLLPLLFSGLLPTRNFLCVCWRAGTTSFLRIVQRFELCAIDAFAPLGLAFALVGPAHANVHAQTNDRPVRRISCGSEL
jgi:hypothetical protein